MVLVVVCSTYVVTISEAERQTSSGPARKSVLLSFDLESDVVLLLTRPVSDEREYLRFGG